MAVAQQLKSKKILILCQKSKVNDWKKDCEDNFDHPIIALEQGKAQSMKELQKLEKMDKYICIAKHTSWWRWAEEMEKHGVISSDTMVIIDESQFYKSRQSAVGKAGVKLAQAVGRCYLLTGDPISNDYTDLFNQLNMLGLDIKWSEFLYLFCETQDFRVPGKPFSIKQVVGHKNVKELIDIVKQFGHLVKTEDVIDLPEQIFTDVHLELDKLGKQTFRTAMKDRVLFDEIALDSQMKLRMACRQIASGYYDSKLLSSHKLDAVEDLLESTPDDFIIFYNFNTELKMLKDLMEKKGIKTFEVNGHTNNIEDRHVYKGRKIVLAQYTSGSMGINLQDIQRIIYFSPTESGTFYKQSMKRSHRLGQRKTCFCYRLITAKTGEIATYRVIETGKDYTSKLFEKELERGYKKWD